MVDDKTKELETSRRRPSVNLAIAGYEWSIQGLGVSSKTSRSDLAQFALVKRTHRTPGRSSRYGVDRDSCGRLRLPYRASSCGCRARGMRIALLGALMMVFCALLRGGGGAGAFAADIGYMGFWRCSNFLWSEIVVV